MFTVCPKCALTLVVTAADLRVAQGYVRCGRCSNVFNALARLSEDRQAGVQTELAPPPAPAAKPDAPPRQSAEAASQPKRYDDDSIPEEDLEFNPASTDLNKVFVEPPASPEFTAATGTFKAIRLDAEESARAAGKTDAPDARRVDPFDPLDTQVDVEIDPELLAAMAQLTNTRPERLNPTPPPTGLSVEPPAEPTAAAPRPSANSTSSTSTTRALGTPKPAPPPAKQPASPRPSMEQAPQPPAPIPLAERAKARVEAARTALEPSRAPLPDPRTYGREGDASKPDDEKAGAPQPESKPKTAQPLEVSFETRSTPLETARALRDALVPRKRSPPAETPSAQQPAAFGGGVWTAGSVVLLLTLVLQVVHHYRHDLAANATFNGPLTSIYGTLGISIVPRWDVGSYEVRQLGASTAADAPGQLTVRASVKNGAHQAQPLPLLRVTLQDRFGNRIAARDVPPQSYLPRAIPRSALLSAGQRIDAEMAFVDPGSNAVGFEIDACLPAPGGGVSCANDTAR